MGGFPGDSGARPETHDTTSGSIASQFKTSSWTLVVGGPSMLVPYHLSHPLPLVINITEGGCTSLKPLIFDRFWEGSLRSWFLPDVPGLVHRESCTNNQLRKDWRSDGDKDTCTTA